MENMKQIFEKHNIEVHNFESKEQAVDYLKAEYQGKKMSFGGSMTLVEMGLYEALRENNEVHWHKMTPGDYTQVADVYISSANGISEKGHIVNIDGRGNRVVGTIYGCNEVIIIVGKNKLTPDLESAIFRAQNIAAPKNAQRLNRKTPCAVKGDKCYDCASPDRICAVTTISTMRPMGMERYSLLVINEDLGY